VGKTRQWLSDTVRAVRDDAEHWTTEKRWVLPRGLLLAYLLYAGLRHLFSPLYRSWFAGITLIFHEMGHLICAGLGQTLHLLAGSLAQLLVPTAATAYLFFKQRDYFGVAVGMSWIAFATWELATYIDDANRELLPLVAFGDDALHDWATLLTDWHLLNHAQTFAFLTRAIATCTWLAAMLLAGWLCYRIWTHRPKPDQPRI
jgi:hypothetical protein